MKNKILLGFAILLLIVPIIASVQAEVQLWGTVIPNNATSIVRHHLFLSFEDTSIKGVGKNKDTPIQIMWNVNNLPFNRTYGQVDWCNLTTRHFQNQYNGKGELENTSIVTYNSYFDSSNTSAYGFLDYNLRSQDSLTADMDCHYTDTQSLFEASALIGTVQVYMPSFECKGCSQYTYEELTKQNAMSDNITAEQIQVYSTVGSVIDLNWKLWLYVIWIAKIFLLLLAIGMIFFSIYWLYTFFKTIPQHI